MPNLRAESLQIILRTIKLAVSRGLSKSQGKLQELPKTSCISALEGEEALTL